MMNAADSKHVYLINTELPHTVLDVIYLYLCLDSWPSIIMRPAKMDALIVMLLVGRQTSVDSRNHVLDWDAQGWLTGKYDWTPIRGGDAGWRFIVSIYHYTAINRSSFGSCWTSTKVFAVRSTSSRPLVNWSKKEKSSEYRLATATSWTDTCSWWKHLITGHFNGPDRAVGLLFMCFC